MATTTRDTSQATDATRFRQVLGQYPTGVCVITALVNEQPIGMTVGTFTSVSLDPPMVAFLPTKSSTSWPLIQRSGRFCVNVLTWDQEHLCRQMARPSSEKFTDVAWRRSDLGSPIIEGSVAWMDCEITQVVEAGDHWIVLGGVHGLDVERETLPLIFFRGGYGRFTPGPLFAEEFDDPHARSLLSVARHEMLDLVNELGGEVAITGIDGDRLVLMASTWSPLSVRASTRVGDEAPAGPPYAISFAAEAGDAAREAWVDKGLSISPDGDREAMLATLRDVADRGWSAAVHLSPAQTWSQRFVDVNAKLAAGEEVAEEFNLTVPIHGQDGEVALAMTVYGRPGRVSRAAFHAALDRLRAAAEHIERARD
ncbi:flavin reductase [Microbacterium sp. zg.Y909]|uniref:flavin reductase n=1 Tax=Microbacterium sp. zg.Y909 TaxID=2969413 RepID=UPI00214BAC3A|nr:flavin reductase [Microbacterium sp. zg.Y909]MCR2824097.1 flavin reductase [Microbacterium sp. zg.Y909]